MMTKKVTGNGGNSNFSNCGVYIYFYLSLILKLTVTTVTFNGINSLQMLPKLLLNCN